MICFFFRKSAFYSVLNLCGFVCICTSIHTETLICMVFKKRLYFVFRLKTKILENECILNSVIDVFLKSFFLCVHAFLGKEQQTNAFPAWFCSILDNVRDCSGQQMLTRDMCKNIAYILTSLNNICCLHPTYVCILKNTRLFFIHICAHA